MEERFLKILPKLQLHGRIFFRHIKCRQSRDEAIAEMVAVAWKWFVGLSHRGKDVSNFPVTFCRFAGFAVKSGRRLCGQEKPKDVMSPVAQKLRGFRVEALPMSSRTSHENLYATVHGQREHDVFEERLQDNTMTPVPDQVAFRLDFAEWLKTWTERDRRIISDMMKGERTFDLSRKYGCSPSRISQKRQQFKEEWDRFCGEAAGA